MNGKQADQPTFRNGEHSALWREMNHLSGDVGEMKGKMSLLTKLVFGFDVVLLLAILSTIFMR